MEKIADIDNISYKKGDYEKSLIYWSNIDLRDFSLKDYEEYCHALLLMDEDRFIKIYQRSIKQEIKSEILKKFVAYFMARKFLEGDDLKNFFLSYSIFETYNQEKKLPVRFFGKIYRKFKNQDNLISRAHKLRIFPDDIASLYYYFLQSTSEHSKRVINALRPLINFSMHTDIHLDKKNARDAEDIVASSNRIAEIIKSMILEGEPLSSDGWSILADICILNKNFDAYYVARKKSRNIMSGMAGVRTGKVLAAMMEEGADIRDLSGTTAHAKYIVGLLRGDIPHFIKMNKKSQDPSFLEYIKNKRVAIVGPVDVGMENGGEIDTFDVIVRLNFRSTQHGINVKVYGSKCHVSYYAGDVIKENDTSPEIREGAKLLDWAVFSGGRDFGINYSGPKIRKVFSVYKYNPCFKGGLNAIPKAIVDIILHEPAAIKVFNANLWLSQSRIPGYHVDFKRNEVNRFIWHDPVSNFLIMKKFYEKNVIEVDEVLKFILEMKEGEYIEKLAILNENY